MTNECIGSLYVHVPFCKKKCLYCDFVSYAGKEGLIGAYVEALTREIESVRPKPYNPLPEGEGVRTIFFGGGTPTILNIEHFNKIISTIICHLSFDIGHSEMSIEANPGTADLEKLKALRSLGIDRLSIGVQSFNDRHLQTLGRIHDSKQALKFYADARSAGFDNINLDLMFALPDQDLNEWQSDLKTAIDLEPEHLSTYNLSIEENSPFWKMYREPRRSVSGGPGNLPDEELELKMYEYTIETLTAAGYKHYEISNFAKPGFECRHNINYWLNGNYIGVGAGAHSHFNGKRWSNPNCIEEYLKETAKFIRRFPGILDQHETLFLGLRLIDGIAIENFSGFEKEVSELLKDGMLEEKNGNYRLTRKGLYLGNLVFEKFV